MTEMLRCREIRQWRWQGVGVVGGAAMVASCGVAGGEGGSSRSTAEAAGSPLRAARSPASSPVLGYQLNGVASASAATAWAAGTSNQNTLHLIRWDGRTWQRVPTPGGGYFNGVAAISGGDAWAVGAGPGNKALIEHWNGTAWTRVTAPSTGGAAILHAVAAVSPDDVWAAGGTNFTGKTVIVHWNGTAWTRVSSPTPPGISSELNSVAATSATNAWAVGDTFTKTGRIPLIEHWNGAAWRRGPSPALPAGGALTGVPATPGHNGWAVGSGNVALRGRLRVTV